MRLTLKVPSALKSQFPSPPLFGHLIVFHRELQRFRGFRQGSSWWTQSLVITLPNKGTLQQCQNYRTINLISLSSKVMLKIILSRLKPQAEEIIAEEQAEFRARRSTTEQIFNVRVLCAIYLQRQQGLVHQV